MLEQVEEEKNYWIRMRKIILLITLIIVGGFISYWIFSLVRCEILTLKYGNEFIGLELQNTMLDPADNLKILSYSGDTAKVYYKDKNIGNILEFNKSNETWLYIRWVDTVWSKQGSADGFIWPYFR